MNTSNIVQKLWNSACLLSVGADKYCNVLRDDLSACGHAQAGSMSYLPASLCSAQASGDYPGSSPGQTDTEQLTLSLALSQRERGSEGNMADVPACTERQVNPVPEIDWS